MKDAPAFDFYPERWLAGTINLSPEDRGAYINLLCYQWLHGSIPASIDDCSRIAGCIPSAAVMAKFQPLVEGLVEGLQGEHKTVLKNGMMERVRDAQRARIAKSREKISKMNTARREKSLQGGLQEPLVGGLQGPPHHSPLTTHHRIDTERAAALPPSEPVTEEEAWKFARNIHSNPQWTKAAVSKWHAHRAANGWTRTNQAGAVTVINSDNWQADLRASHSWATILPKTTDSPKPRKMLNTI